MKKSFYDAVIFDLDGTLLDTTEGVLASIVYTMNRMNLEIPNRKELLKFIGPPIQESFINYYGIDVDEAQHLAEIFRERYKNVDLYKAKAYDNIFDVLREIKRASIPIAVATYKRQDYAESILKHFGFYEYINSVIGADSNNQLRKTDIIKLSIDTLKIFNYKKCVMIGDTVGDAIGAKEVGCPFIGVTYGFGFSDTDEVIRFDGVGCVNNTMDLLKIIF